MLTSNETLKKKLRKKLNNEQKTFCTICRKAITSNDIETENFVYANSKFGEHFAHLTCFQDLPKYNGGVK